MSIIERREEIGSFDIRLKENTPAHITRQMRVSRDFYGPVTDSKGFGIVAVTNQWIDPSDLPSPAQGPTSYHPLPAVARWCGVLRDVGDRGRTLSGHGLLGLLLDSDGVGSWATDFVDAVPTAVASTVVRRAIEGGAISVAGGGTKSFDESQLLVGSMWTETTVLDIPKEKMWSHLDVIRTISQRVGYHFHVDPTGRFNWATAEGLWGTDPRVVIGAALPAESDPTWPTVRASLDDWGETTEKYLYRLAGDGIGTYGPSWSATQGPHYYSGLTGRPIESVTDLPYDDDSETYALWKFRADLTVAYWAFNQWTATVTGDLIGGDHLALVPGEQVWLYDAALGIADTDNDISYAGEPIHPVKVPIVASTWEPSEGMGVYLMWSDGGAQQVMDLTDHVEMAETRTVNLELGAPAATL